MTEEQKNTHCIFCGEKLNSTNVYLWKIRKGKVDKCDYCCDRMESGEDMYY